MRIDTSPAAAAVPAVCSTRTTQRHAGAGGVVDRFEGGAECSFLRLAPAADGQVRLAFEGEGRLAACAAGGWLLTLAGGAGQTLWFPAPPLAARFDAQARLTPAPAPPLLGFGLSAAEGWAAWRCEPGQALYLVAWRLPGADAAGRLGLDELTVLEQQGVFMLGTHDTCRRPADVYAHLVDGRVYENRKAWPHEHRICSENDAHALHLAAAGLHAATAKPMYALLREQIVLSVLARQSEDGGFRHGEWTERMESHYRLHCSAMHLMMDALAEGPDPAVERALRAAAAFIARQSVALSVGRWFLHDELEHSVEALRAGPFKWVPSAMFGKAESNMMVLNSHLDATIALDRYAEVSGDGQYAGLVAEARAAARAVLALRPAEALYRLLFALIGTTFLPAAEAAALPLWRRALKRLTWQRLIPRLPELKARWPRFVMPGGYIDRELVLRTWAHDYHAVNLMDLARYLRRFGDDAPAREALLQGLAFARESGLVRRWKEMPYQRYALGFWAEALYHACTLFPDARYRAWLAEAMLELDDLGMGQPPSLLGANAEAVPAAQRMPCPVPAAPGLLVANLGRRDAPELLVVNARREAQPLAWAVAPPPGLAWRHVDGSAAEAAGPVPARGRLEARR